MKIISNEVTFLIEFNTRETKQFNDRFPSSRDIEAFNEVHRLGGMDISYKDGDDSICVSVSVDLTKYPIREARGLVENLKKSLQEEIRNIQVCSL